MTIWTIATLERDLQPADMDGAVVVAQLEQQGKSIIVKK